MRTSNYYYDGGTHVYLEEFANIREFVKFTDIRPENLWSHKTYVDEEDRQHLVYGWPEMTSKINKSMSKLRNIKTADKKIKVKTYAQKGYYPNVGKALRGNTKCMGKYNKVKTQTKIVEIIWDCGALSCVEPDDIENQGTDLLLKIKELEGMGYRVRLMVQGFKGNEQVTDNYMARITIKEENQPLDISRIAYPLVNVEMLRTWIFKWYEHIPNANYISGYGKSLYAWSNYNRIKLLKAVNIKPNQYYVNLKTDIDSMFETLTSIG